MPGRGAHLPAAECFHPCKAFFCCCGGEAVNGGRFDSGADAEIVEELEDASDEDARYPPGKDDERAEEEDGSDMARIEALRREGNTGSLSG